MKQAKHYCLCKRGSVWKLRWDLFIIFCAIFNAFTIPITVAFPDWTFMDTLYAKVFGYFIDFFFLCDIIVNFRTTILNRTGEEVTSSIQIAVEYMKSRFLIDFLATVPFDDIASIFISKSQSFLLSTFGILKLVWVLWLSRIITFLNVRSDIKMSLKVFKIIFFLIIYLHCVGCCWFWIVSISETWLPSSHEFDGGNFY